MAVLNGEWGYELGGKRRMKRECAVHQAVQKPLLIASWRAVSGRLRDLCLVILVLLGHTITVQASVSPPPQETVRFAVEGAYPPFSWTEPNGRVMGFDVDIAHALCREMAVRCEIVAQAWPDLIPDLLTHHYDAIIAAMSITEARQQQVAFTEKYAQLPSRYVARRDADLTFTPEGLQGKVLGVVKDTVQDDYVTAQFGLTNRIIRSATMEGAHADLVKGRVDAVLGEAPVLEAVMLNVPGGQQFGFVGPSLSDPQWFGNGFGIAVRPDDTRLRQRLNEAITAIRAKGIYQNIAAPYFNYDVYGR